jgi:hypothetical protein
MWTGIWLVLTQAWALDASCEESYDVNNIVEGMNAVEDLLVLERYQEVTETLGSMKGAMPCSVDRLHPAHIARFARLMAIDAFHEQDDFSMVRWGRLSSVARSPWPDGYGPDHAVREALSYVELPEDVRPPGQVVRPPSGGGMLVDGRLLQTPEVPGEMPHFVQIVDRTGWVVSAYWQDGGLFPPDWIGGGSKVASLPRWYREPTGEFDPTQRVYISPSEREDRAKRRRQEVREASSVKHQQSRVMEEQAQRAERRVQALEREQEREVLVEPLDAEAAEALASTQWQSFEFDVMDIDSGAEKAKVYEGCEDLFALSGWAREGQLTLGQVRCLEEALRYERRMTRKVDMSRILMADAYVKDETHRWEGIVHRHLTEIDRSDPDLCYLYARYLAGLGEESLLEAIRWAGIALESAVNWQGPERVPRMQHLHRIQTVGAHLMWLKSEAFYQERGEPSAREAAGFWRSQTKALSREWIDFATVTQGEKGLPYNLCFSAAGNVDYCRRD